MRRYTIPLAAVLTAAVAAPGAALAADAVTTVDLNMRAGPSTAFPVVEVIPDQGQVDVHGCVRDYQWCDVTWRGARGWVFADYLRYYYANRYVPLVEYGPRIDLPIISFSFGSYWDDHYRGRPWYRQRGHWRSVWRGVDRDHRVERRENRREERIERRRDRRVERREERRERAAERRRDRRAERREERRERAVERRRDRQIERRQRREAASERRRERQVERRQQRRQSVEQRSERRLNQGQARQQRRESLGRAQGQRQGAGVARRDDRPQRFGGVGRGN